MDIQYYFIYFLLWLISTLILRSIFKKPTNQTTLLHLPPSPSGLPVIGHLHHFKYKSLQNLSSKYGPLLQLRLGFTPCVLVSSASIATEIFKTQDLTFSGRPPYGDDDRMIFGGSGFILAPYGDYWRFVKKLFVTELLGTRQLERSRSVRREELTRFLCKVLEKAHKNEVVDVGCELMKLTNNVTCRMVMSTRCSGEDGEADRIREMVKEVFKKSLLLTFAGSMGPLKKLGFWLYGKQIMDLTSRLDELLERVLKEHEERGNRDGEKENKDMMDILLEVHQDDKAEFKITRNQIKALILDVFLAGTSTSAEAMQWAMAELINHPRVFKKAREEIESVVGTTRLVEETDIPSLPYLQAIVKETLRLHPPGPITSRECREHCKIKGFDIPEKIEVLINLYAIMRDPELWDNPNDFNPERFLVSSKENANVHHIQNQTKGQIFNFVPFGAGRRGCPGENLANILMNTTIAAMVQCVDWKVGGGGDGTKINFEVGSGVSMAMAHPLLCLPVVHFNPFAT